MAAEHRRRHKTHLDQHVKDVSGDYHYIGDWYVLSGGKRKLLPLQLWSLAMAACVIGAGCVRFAGMRNTWYVILPYLFSVGMLLGLALQLIRLMPGRLKTFDWERTCDKVTPFAGACGLFALLAAVLGGVFLALHRDAGRMLDALFFAALLLAAVCSRMAISAYRCQEWKKQKEELRLKENL